jgi:Spy/CpxP family protein refolding chaperone
MRGSRALVGLLAAAVVVAAVSTRAFTQRSGGGAPATPLEQTRLNILESGFKLNKDQKKAVKTILDEAHKSAAPVREALTRTHAAIAAAIQSGKSQEIIDAAVNEYAQQAAAMTALEMQALAQVLQTLDPEQRANAPGVRSAFFLMRGIFLDNKRWDDVPDSRGY